MNLFSATTTETSREIVRETSTAALRLWLPLSPVPGESVACHRRSRTRLHPPRLKEEDGRIAIRRAECLAKMAVIGSVLER